MNLPALAARCAGATPTKVHSALPLLLMGVLYGTSSIPGRPLPDNPAVYSLFYWMSPELQNVLHIPAFAALAWAWHWTLGAWLPPSGAQTPRLRAIGAVAIASAYGLVDEWHQSYVPGRYASLTDILLDVAGAVLGIGLAAWLGGYASNSAVQ